MCGLGSLEPMTASAVPCGKEEETKGLREVVGLEWACCAKSEDLLNYCNLPVTGMLK